jgi:IclR family transcriptional regulator, acetate operon repressor
MPGEQGETVNGVERAVEVLNLFSRSPGSLGVTEISQELGYAKAVVHRILQAFKAKGYVEADEVTRRYSLGPSAVFLGLAYLDRLDVRSVARSALAELSAATNETATLSIRFGDERIYVDQVNPSRDVQMVVSLGKPFPLHAGASSRAFLAFLSDDEQAQYLAKEDLAAVTDQTMVDPAALREELVRIRAEGLATSVGESDPGTVAAAAPVFDRDGLCAVISVCGPRERLEANLGHAGAMVRDLAKRTSARLGHR